MYGHLGCFQLLAFMGNVHKLSCSCNLVPVSTYFCGMYVLGSWQESQYMCVFLLLYNIHCFLKRLYKFIFLPSIYKFLLLHIFLDIWYCCNLEFSSSLSVQPQISHEHLHGAYCQARKMAKQIYRIIKCEKIHQEKAQCVENDRSDLIQAKKKTLFRDPVRETETQAKVLALKVKFKADIRGIFEVLNTRALPIMSL